MTFGLNHLQEKFKKLSRLRLSNSGLASYKINSEKCFLINQKVKFSELDKRQPGVRPSKRDLIQTKNNL